jgi:glycosyltransferase involved in cell wall biosynthesis
MRIAYLLPAEYAIGNPGNGVTAQARAQAAAMSRLGHDVVYLNPWTFQQEEEIDVLHFFMGGLALYGIQSSRRLPRTGILVMSPILDTNKAHWLYRLAAYVGSLSGRINSIPTVLSAQARGSDILICRSQVERQNVIHKLGVAPERASVVLNGVDVPERDEQFMKVVKERYHLPDRFLLHVSAYTDPRKNVLRLAAAATQLGLPLVVAGHAMPGPIATELQAIARRSGLLRLLGFVERRTRDALYGLCDTFCLPSHHEGTGLAALEAGAAGARIVITLCGGTRDYFDDMAFYVSPTNVKSIRQALKRAWDTPPSATLQRHIRTTLSWDTSASSLARAYEIARNRKTTGRA